MTIDEYLKTIISTTPKDWTVVTRPTLRHAFAVQVNDSGEEERIDFEEPPAILALKKNLSITIAVGTVEQAKYKIPVPTPFSQHNARTLLADCFYDNVIVHRERLVSVDRQHCILPLPTHWTKEKQPIALGKVAFAQLIHELVGPFSDFGEYFEQSGMVPSELPWPAPTKPAQTQDMALPVDSGDAGSPA
ncbi:MAG: hypothetical protein NXI16_07545 [Alphaproteobacteria bacterium]|nr:hypothetical protein [Alphaproteobacteria bacterium]